MLDGAIRKIFGLKHPFGSHNVDVGRVRNQNSGVVILQNSNLIIHNRKPSRFLVTNLKPLDSMDARRAEKRLKDPRRARSAGWRVLKIPTLARVIMG